MKSLLIFGFFFVWALTGVDSQCPGEFSSTTNVVLLLNQNNLLWFPPNTTNFRVMPITGINGNIQSIDTRPRGNTLWGVSNTRELYRIDPLTGVATRISNFSLPLPPKNQALDFNPVNDRLRFISRRANFRLDADSGLASTEGSVSYVPNDPNRDRYSKFVGIAYTNNNEGAVDTTLYGIDTQSKKKFYLTTIDTPSSGNLTTVGQINIQGERFGGFDIYTSPSGCNTAVFAMDGRFWFIDLATGGATQVWQETSAYFNRYFRFKIWGITFL